MAPGDYGIGLYEVRDDETFVPGNVSAAVGVKVKPGA
jgi:hypothetical protein